MSPLIEHHCFRFGNPWFDQAVGIKVSIPVSGVVVVPTKAKNVDGYVRHRQAVLGPRLVALMITNNPDRYRVLLVAAMYTPETRQHTGLSDEFVFPDDKLTHQRPAHSCAACRAAFLAHPAATTEIYALRQQQLAAAAANYEGAVTPEALAGIEAACNGLTNLPH